MLFADSVCDLLVCKYVPLWVPFDSYEALNIEFTLDVYVHIELDAITNVGRSNDPSCRWISLCFLSLFS